MAYAVHTVATAPDAAKETLAGAQKAFGFLPNLLGVMAEAPSLVKAYAALIGLFEETSLSPAERQTVLLAASYENNCDYCIAAHSVIAGMQKVPADVIDAIRDNRPIPDRKLEALRRFTTAVVSSRGWPSQAETSAFLSAGYEKRQILEVVLGVGFKTLSNYTTHITHTPLDQAFAKAEWTKAA
ncbi:MAG: carboxymuconolactone decarboxylase family protein [Rhodospirillales bacterium]|nr:MAG: carboxymuconolactone decarboxylase family protein [Rhodospirillales bacterium]